MSIFRQIMKNIKEDPKNYVFLANNLANKALFNEIKDDIMNIFV